MRILSASAVFRATAMLQVNACRSFSSIEVQASAGRCQEWNMQASALLYVGSSSPADSLLFFCLFSRLDPRQRPVVRHHFNPSLFFQHKCLLSLHYTRRRIGFLSFFHWLLLPGAPSRAFTAPINHFLLRSAAIVGPYQPPSSLSLLRLHFAQLHFLFHGLIIAILFSFNVNLDVIGIIIFNVIFIRVVYFR